MQRSCYATDCGRMKVIEWMDTCRFVLNAVAELSCVGSGVGSLQQHTARGNLDSAVARLVATP
jgi:hypothetical protein